MNVLHRILLILLLIAGTSLSSADAQAATLTYCPSWKHSYTDQGKGEDYLLHSSGQAYGLRAAAYTYAYLRKNGVTLHEGYLNSLGLFSACNERDWHIRNHVDDACEKARLERDL